MLGALSLVVEQSGLLQDTRLVVHLDTEHGICYAESMYATGRMDSHTLPYCTGCCKARWIRLAVHGNIELSIYTYTLKSDSSKLTSPFA